MSFNTNALLYVEHPPTPEEHDAITAVVADGQRFGRLDKSVAGGHNDFGGSVYAAGFDFVTAQQIEAFVAALPLRGDVVLYMRPQGAVEATIRIRPEVRPRD